MNTLITEVHVPVLVDLQMAKIKSFQDLNSTTTQRQKSLS